MPNEQFLLMISELRSTVEELKQEVKVLKEKDQKYELLFIASTSSDVKEREDALYELAQMKARKQQRDELRGQFK